MKRFSLNHHFAYGILGVSFLVCSLYSCNNSNPTISTETLSEPDPVAEPQVDTIYDTLIVHDTLTIHDTVKIAKTNKDTDKAKAPKVTRVDLGYAYFKGDVRNGKPHGNGEMTFKNRQLIPGTNNCIALQGETVVGTWRDGKINMGTWFRNNGDRLTVNYGSSM